MSGKQQVREAVAVFDTVEDMEAAIDALLTCGFSRAELSLLASEKAIQEKLGHTFISTRDLEDNPDAPFVAYLARESFGSLDGYAIGGLLYLGAIAGFVPVLASGGAIGAAIIAGALGAGGGTAIGSILATMIEKHHADFLDIQLQNGGILLWVRTRDKEHENRATDILSRHSAKDVHVHGIAEESEKLGEYYSKATATNSPPGMTFQTYRDVQVTVASDGHCYAVNRVFTSKTEAFRYIDLVRVET